MRAARLWKQLPRTIAKVATAGGRKGCKGCKEAGAQQLREPRKRRKLQQPEMLGMPVCTRIMREGSPTFFPIPLPPTLILRPWGLKNTSLSAADGRRRRRNDDDDDEHDDDADNGIEDDHDST